MKRFAWAATALVLAACSGQDAKKEEGEQAAMTFANDGDKALYVVASRYGDQMRQNLAQIKEMGVTYDDAILVKGFQDGLMNKVAVNEADGAAAIQKFGEELQTKQKEMAGKKSTENKAKGEAYVAEFDKQEGVVKTASGLRYKVLTEGNGKTKPSKDDTVKVHYRGTLIDGTEFDSSYKRNAPAEFGVSQVIPGWTEALQLMSKGAKYQLVIPADIAYGDRDGGSIPAGSTLVFEVELLDVMKASAK